MQPTGDKTLLVNEIFGPTWQGEGPQRGQVAAFVRLGTCNLACWWCDTPYAVFYDKHKADNHYSKKVYDPKVELHRMTPGEIFSKVASLVDFNSLVVFSGGEPALQQEGLITLIEVFKRYSWSRFAIETAGTIDLAPLVMSLHLPTSLQITVSPKLANSYNDKEARYKPEVLQRLAYWGATFKFVVKEVSDYEEVHEIVKACSIGKNQVWIMPEGEHADEVLENGETIAPYALEQQWNFTLRDHIILFGNKRGV